MTKVSTNIALDPELKLESQRLFADLGMDLTTAVTVFLKQSVRVQGLPFSVTKDSYNDDTLAAFREFEEMRKDSQKYKRYDSFKVAMKEVLDEK